MLNGAQQSLTLEQGKEGVLSPPKSPYSIHQNPLIYLNLTAVEFSATTRVSGLYNCLSGSMYYTAFFGKCLNVVNLTPSVAKVSVTYENGEEYSGEVKPMRRIVFFPRRDESKRLRLYGYTVNPQLQLTITYTDDDNLLELPIDVMEVNCKDDEMMIDNEDDDGMLQSSK